VLTLRPFDRSDSDYEAIVEIWNAHFPDLPSTVEEQKYADSVREPDRLWGRVVAEEDGRIVATGFYKDPTEVESPGEYLLHVSVLPECEGRGVGTRVYDHVTALLAERDPAMLMSFACEDEPDHVRFLTKRGYETVMREQDSRLDVASFDRSRFNGLEQRIADLGIEIRTARELEEENPPGWQRELYELDWILTQDEPSTAPHRKTPFETYVKHHFEAPGYVPDAFFIAFEDGRMIARSALWKNLGSADKIFTGFTGTAREHRGKGVATLLKIRGIEYAGENGWTTIETGNEESNPMYKLNVKLGFEPVPAWYWMRKTLKKHDEDAA